MDDHSMDHVEAPSNGPPQPQQQHMLGSILKEEQLFLQFEHVCAWVNSSFEPPPLATKLRRAFSQQQRRAAEAQQRQILYNISGDIPPGEVLALMGPSGSGKTSLLSVISGRAPRAVRTRGRISANGVRFSKAAKRRTGFVLQDDVLYESLTVNETLEFAAALRLPRSFSAAERRERVEAVIDALGLQKCRDTIIGGFFQRGVSGGERKRVSIGHELLVNPALIMLDEPTSGLDSTTALHLLVTLRQLALGGRAIVTTIHQPSSRLYQQLDKLMLLADGHVAYYGRAEQVVPWMNHLGFELPYGVSVADFLLDVAQGEVAVGAGGAAAAAPAGVEGSAPGGTAGYGRDGKHTLLPQAAGSGAAAALEGPGAIQALWSSYESFARLHPPGCFEAEQQLQHVRLLLQPPDGASKAATATATSASTSFLQRVVSLGRQKGAAPPQQPQQQQQQPQLVVHQALDVEGDALPPVHGLAGDGGGGGGLSRLLGTGDRGGASYWTQLRILFMRSIKVRRFESLSGQRFVQLVAVAVITGLFWWQRGAHNPLPLAAASDVSGLLFFELLFPSFSTLFSALFTFPSDYRMLIKERQSGMYRLSAFYFSRMACDLPMEFAYPGLFVLVVYFMGGLRLAGWAVVANLLSMLLLVLVAESVGLVLGASFMNPKTAQTAASIIMLGFMLVGGYFVRSIPVWVQWVKYLSFVWWGFNLLLKIEFSGREVVLCSGGVDALVATGGGAASAAAPPACVPVSVGAALELPTDPDASVLPEVLVLLGMMVVLRAAVYVVLRRKTKPAS